MGDVTEILQAARHGESLAVGRIVELLYPQLRRIARARLGHRDDRLLLDTGGLVHETYLHLLGKQQLLACDRGHFLAYAAQVMRHLLVDAIRGQRCQRRGGGRAGVVTLDTALLDGTPDRSVADEALRVHEALEELARIDERLVRVVEMRYFVGLSTTEIAEALDVSRHTVERDWDKARIFLFNALSPEPR